MMDPYVMDDRWDFVSKARPQISDCDLALSKLAISTWTQFSPIWGPLPYQLSIRLTQLKDKVTCGIKKQSIPIPKWWVWLSSTFVN